MTDAITEIYEEQQRAACDITFTLPMPSSKINPNSRHHFHVQAKIKKECRALAYAVARKATTWRNDVPFPLARVERIFFFRDKRDRDGDNFAAACKSYLDGIVDAGLIVDDCFRCLPELIATYGGVDRKNPRVVFCFWKLKT